MAERDQIVVDVKLLGCTLEDMMADKLGMALNASIFKTPKILFRHNESAYIPHAFSFGPFHCKDEQLKLTQRIKWKYMQGLLRRSPNRHLKWRELIDAIASLKDPARQCYAGSVDLDDQEFIEVLVLDGCFIIELFRKDYGNLEKESDDPIYAMSCFLEYLNHDLILLENQIPWLVLKHLFGLTKVNDSESLITLTLEYFANIFSSKKPETKPEKFHGHNIKHILDLLRQSLVLPLGNGPTCSNQKRGWEPCPSAMKMQESGIKLRRVNTASILDIKFRNGVLEIPPLLIQETTETLFRNLISFEQCCPNYEPIVTSYAKLMDSLIDTNKDVELLYENLLIDNWLNIGDVTQFFKKLYYDARVKNFYYHHVCQDVNQYCGSYTSRLRFAYMHKYCGSPWAVVSQVVENGEAIEVLSYKRVIFCPKRLKQSVDKLAKEGHALDVWHYKLTISGELYAGANPRLKKLKIYSFSSLKEFRLVKNRVGTEDWNHRSEEELSLEVENKKMIAMVKRDEIVIDLRLFGHSFEDIMADRLSMSLNASIFGGPKILSGRMTESIHCSCIFLWSLSPQSRTAETYRKCSLHRSPNPEQKFWELIDTIKLLKETAREYYAGLIELGEQEFVEVLVLDGGFIIVLFRKDYSIVPKDSDDTIFSMSCFLEYLNHDLILLENQIPWLVLDRLFSLIMVSEQESLITLTLINVLLHNRVR